MKSRVGSYKITAGLAWASACMRFLVLGAFIVPALLMARDGLCEGPRVAVFPIKNNGQAQYNGLASGLSAMFTTNLVRPGAIDVVEPQAVYDALKSTRLIGGAPSVSDALKAARDAGAQYALTGEFVLFGGKFRIDIRLYEVATGGLRYTDKAQDLEGKLFDKVDLLSNGILIELVGSLPKQKGALKLGSDPAGALVYIDDDRAGETPLVLADLPPGAYNVTFELQGYKPFTGRVTVKEGETAELTTTLEPLLGGVRVSWGGEPNSDVRLGPNTISISSFQYSPLARYCSNMPAGTYTASVRMPYKEEGSWEDRPTTRTYSAEVEVRAGEVVDVFINNSMFSPSVDVGACPECVEDWDFESDIVWYETR